MTAALSLLEIFDGWELREGLTPLAVRKEEARSAGWGQEYGGRFHVWDRMGYAVSLIRELDTALHALRDDYPNEVERFLTQVPIWYRTAFSAERPLNAKVDHRTKVMKAEAFQSLRDLDDFLGRVAPSETLSETERRELWEMFNGIMSILATASEDLTAAERIYLLRLVAAARQMLEEKSALQTYDITVLIDQLVGMLVRLAEDQRHPGHSAARKSLARAIAGKLDQIVTGASPYAQLVGSVAAVIALTTIMPG